MAGSLVRGVFRSPLLSCFKICRLCSSYFFVSIFGCPFHQQLREHFQIARNNQIVQTVGHTHTFKLEAQALALRYGIYSALTSSTFTLHLLCCGLSLDGVFWKSCKTTSLHIAGMSVRISGLCCFSQTLAGRRGCQPLLHPEWKKKIF